MVVVFLIALPGIFIDIYGYYGSFINQKFTMSLDETEFFLGGEGGKGGGILVWFIFSKQI